MKNPKTNTQEVLNTLITQGHVSILDYPYLSGFRTRVSELQLKHGVGIRTEKNTAKNKFGNVFVYHKHYLTDLENAKKIYNEMTESN